MRRVLLGSLALGLLVLGGCGGGNEPDTVKPPPSSSSTLTASPSVDSPPSAPPGQFKFEGSANAYARFAFKTLMYSYEHRDMAPFYAIAIKSECAGCRKYGDALVERQNKGHYKQVPDHPAAVKSVISKSHQGDRNFNMRVTFDQPSGKQVGDDGKLRERLDPAPGSTFDVKLRWVGKGWRVTDYILNWGS